MRARSRAALGALFPVAPEKAPLQPAQRAFSVILQVVAVCLGTVVLLAREAHIPAWDCMYAEDYGVYFVQALHHPWQVFVPYGGYLQLVPRLIGQAASLVPLKAAAAVFAVVGTAIAVGCALFTYHASAGFIGSRTLRAVLGAALVLLPIAPLEVVGNGVNSTWYITAALFWAALWRPRTRSGMAVAAMVAFAATTSTPMAIIYTPLLAARVFALPRLREHAVTAGWLAGWVVQIPVILYSYANHTQRLRTFAPPAKTIVYYLHTVVLRALGWHLSWRLESVAGRNGATVIVGASLAVILGWAAITQGRQVRVFVVTAVATGFAYTVLAAFITRYVVFEAPLSGPVAFEPGSRYSVVPIFLLDAALIVAADAVLRRGGAAAGLATVRPRVLVAVAALGCVLAVGWVTDFRYLTQRTTDGHWQHVAAKWLNTCEHSRTGTITVPAWVTGKVTVSCSSLRR